MSDLTSAKDLLVGNAVGTGNTNPFTNGSRSLPRPPIPDAFEATFNQVQQTDIDSETSSRASEERMIRYEERQRPQSPNEKMAIVYNDARMDSTTIPPSYSHPVPERRRDEGPSTNNVETDLMVKMKQELHKNLTEMVEKEVEKLHNMFHKMESEIKGSMNMQQTVKYGVSVQLVMQQKFQCVVRRRGAMRKDYSVHFGDVIYIQYNDRTVGVKGEAVVTGSDWKEGEDEWAVEGNTGELHYGDPAMLRNVYDGRFLQIPLGLSSKASIIFSSSS